MSERRINFASLDALRGMLALYVALGHCRWLLWSGHAAWLASPHAGWEVIPAYASALLRYGREAVFVFFVLSGFFIHYRAADIRGREQFRAMPFYRRRLHRLAPPFYLALAVTVVLDMFGRAWWPTLYEARTGDVVVDTTLIVGGYSPASILPALAMLPSSLGRDFGSNGPLWSIAYEAVYYALYPLWLRLRIYSSVAAFVVLPAAAALVALAPRAFPIDVIAHYPIWLAGAWLAERLTAARPSRHDVAIGAAVFAAGAVFYVLIELSLLRVVASVAFGAGLVLAFAGAQSRKPIWRSAFEWLGVRSYSIYIMHFPVVALLSAYAFERLGGRPAHGWLAVAGALVSVGFGVACFTMCERHFLHSRYRDEAAAP